MTVRTISDVLAVDVHKLDDPRVPLNERGNVAVFRARNEIAFPVPRQRSVLGLGGPLADRHGFNDLAARLALSGLGSAHHAPASEVHEPARYRWPIAATSSRLLAMLNCLFQNCPGVDRDGCEAI